MFILMSTSFYFFYLHIVYFLYLRFCTCFLECSALVANKRTHNDHYAVHLFMVTDFWYHSQTFKYSILDAVPPIHAESSHVATDKVPSK